MPSSKRSVARRGGGLSASDKAARLNTMQRLAGEAASYFEGVLPEALQKYQQIIVLTHVPPFLEARWHEGAISSADYLPHFASFVTGDRLLRAMSSNRRRKMLVLCGHTHSGGKQKFSQT